jgi:Cu-Zn family superoxide dismutase
MTRRIGGGLALLMATAGLASCSFIETQGPRAVAKLEATKGNTVWGSVSFVETGDAVTVRADVRGLRPGAEFGFHVHEKGDCSSDDGMSAGGHFNPGGHPHGHFTKAERHAGDMPNLRSDGEGNATLAFETKTLTVSKSPTSVVGRAVIVHANPDDYTSQPAGNAGPRIACGLIRAAD